MLWTDCFSFVKLRRGRVIVPFHGEIDFSRDDLPLELLRDLYEADFPHLKLTDFGRECLYGIPQKPFFNIPDSKILDLPVQVKKKSRRKKNS